MIAIAECIRCRNQFQIRLNGYPRVSCSSCGQEYVVEMNGIRNGSPTPEVGAFFGGAFLGVIIGTLIGGYLAPRWLVPALIKELVKIVRPPS